MNEINFAGIDLNLLTAFAALLRERSVTRAARRVGVGQSAMSHSLRRLRELFSDPLFVRVGRGIEPTPRALALMDPLMTALVSIKAVLEDAGGFDPTTSTRTFRLLCSDLLAAFLPDVLESVTSTGPHVTLEVASPTHGVTSVLRAGDSELALAVPQTDSSGCKQQTLGQLDWVVLARAKHPLGSGRLTVARYRRFSHIQVRTGSASRSVVADDCKSAGLERAVSLIVPSFVAAAFTVARSYLLFTAPRLLVAELARLLRLQCLEPPIPIPLVPVVALWPDRLDGDRAQIWFRNQINEVTAKVLPRSR